MNFFFDRCVPRRIARVLDAYDVQNTIIHQDDDNRFDQTTQDVVLIETIASDQPSPAFVTADQAMLRRSVERMASANSKLTIIFLRPSWNDLSFHLRTVKLMSLWPSIVQRVERCREPTAFESTSSARKLEQLCLTRDLLPKAKRKR